MEKENQTEIKEASESPEIILKREMPLAIDQIEDGMSDEDLEKLKKKLEELLELIKTL